MYFLFPWQAYRQLLLLMAIGVFSVVGEVPEMTGRTLGDNEFFAKISCY